MSQPSPSIQVLPYNPNWPNLFEQEAIAIQRALGDNCIAIHHIGSTSVPGLSAKPLIDILPVVRDILQVDPANRAMEELGYEAKGEHGMAFRRYFQKGGRQRTHNVHVYQEGHPEIERHLKFRNWMRLHKQDAEAYAKLKMGLAEECPQDIYAYCVGKEAFVTQIMRAAGVGGWRFVEAVTPQEWELVKRLTPDTSSGTHLVLYMDLEPVGCANLELESPIEASLNWIAIEPGAHQRGLERLLLELCERWLFQRGIRKLRVSPCPTSPRLFSVKDPLLLIQRVCKRLLP